MHITDPAEKSWIQERIEGPDKEISFTAEGKRAILKKLIEGESVREVRAQAPSRHQALRPRWRRSDDPGAGADHQARRRTWRRRDRARHGPPRPAQRARGRDGQAVPGDLPRIPRRFGHARRRAGFGRCEVSFGRVVRSRVRRQHRPPFADGESLAPRNRQSRRARQGARQASAARNLDRRRRSAARTARARDAAADPWRRGVRGAGRCGRVLRAVGAARLSHRRHHALHHQQPDRLHDRAALFALKPISERRCA